MANSIAIEILCKLIVTVLLRAMPSNLVIQLTEQQRLGVVEMPMLQPCPLPLPDSPASFRAQQQVEPALNREASLH